MKTQVSNAQLEAKYIRHELGESVQAIYLTGSVEICDPPVLSTDVDYVVLVTNRDDFKASALSAEYDQTSNDEYEGLCTDFTCYRRGTINLIVTDDPHFYIAVS